VAGPFLEGVNALDGDARLFAGEVDCAKTPLVEHLATRPLGENIRLTAARRRERLALEDVAEAVFVTGVRDFGPEAPAGIAVTQWFDRVKAALPGRAAAIGALLLPPADAGSTSALPQAGAQQPGVPQGNGGTR
jgi:hypothetical protein